MGWVGGGVYRMEGGGGLQVLPGKSVNAGGTISMCPALQAEPYHQTIRARPAVRRRTRRERNKGSGVGVERRGGESEGGQVGLRNGWGGGGVYR